jgi:hypothetical protein
MNIINGKLVLDSETCYCMQGKVYGKKVCPDCNGTCEGKRGGKNGCKTCYNGTVIDHDNMIDCERCGGTNKVEETRYSHIKLIRDDFPMVVDRGDRIQTFNEAYIGHGAIYSVTDYGDHKHMTDAELLDHIWSDDRIRTQYCTIINEDMVPCSKIVVKCNNNGYSLVPVWEED